MKIKASFQTNEKEMTQWQQTLSKQVRYTLTKIKALFQINIKILT